MTPEKLLSDIWLRQHKKAPHFTTGTDGDGQWLLLTGKQVNYLKYLLRSDKNWKQWGKRWYKLGYGGRGIRVYDTKNTNTMIPGVGYRYGEYGVVKIYRKHSRKQMILNNTNNYTNTLNTAK